MMERFDCKQLVVWLPCTVVVFLVYGLIEEFIEWRKRVFNTCTISLKHGGEISTELGPFGTLQDNFDYFYKVSNTEECCYMYFIFY